MNTAQIYELVNDVAKQALGEEALAVADTSALISLGDTVLSSQTNTEAFLNTLAQRIGRTIFRYREYRNKMGDMVLDAFTWGAILQKLRVVVPEAEEDERYKLVNGQSIDMYKVAKPTVDQKLFVTRTPYQFHITIQRITLREAFLSDVAMGSFISQIYGEVRNKIEFSLENLARLTIATGIAIHSANEIKLVSDYNTETGETLTAVTSLHSPEFMAFAIGRMNHIMDMLTDMSTQWADGSVATFTPYDRQKFRVISDFERRLETVVQYQAFHDNYTRLGVHQTLNFWQAEQSPMNISITPPGSESAVNVSNIVAVLHDADACGIYQEEEETLTSPVNAAGSYYNQYWHRKDGRMLDRSENFVFFTLN